MYGAALSIHTQKSVFMAKLDRATRQALRPLWIDIPSTCRGGQDRLSGTSRTEQDAVQQRLDRMAAVGKYQEGAVYNAAARAR